MTSAQGLRRAAATVPYGKLAIAAAGAFYLYVAAVSVAQAQGDLGAIGWPKLIGLAVAPICMFCAIRYPVVFPFGLYIALAPFDSLLQVAGSSSIVKFIGFFVLAALTLRMLRLRTLYVPQQAWYLWLGLILYSAVTLLWTPDADNGWRTFFSIFSLFLMMTLLAAYPIRRREFDVILIITVASGFIAALYCVHQFYSGGATHDSAPRLDFSNNGFAIDENYLAGSFLLPLAIVTATVFGSRSLLLKAVCALSIFAFLAAIFVNGSRDALLGIIAIFAYFVVRSRHRIAALGIGGLAMSSILLFPNITSRLFTADFADGSGRTEIWKAGMHSFGDHWLLGAGIGSFQEIYDHNVLQVFMRHFTGWHRPGHSIVFVSLNDYGVLGSLLVVACWYFSVRQLRVISPESPLYVYRQACEAAILGLAVQALFLDPSYIKYVWFALSLPLLLLNLAAPRAVGLHRRILAPQFGPSPAAQPYRGG